MKKITLSELKEIEIELLDTVVEVCKEYHLRYYLTAGTLLGAIRHQGFIPWDDDIDIVMPRPDYEKLKYCLKDRVLKGKYKLLSYEHGGTKYNFMKMVHTQTVLYETYMTGEIGVWIDIFPIDGLPDSYVLTRLLCFKLEFYRRLLLMSFSAPNVGKTSFRKYVKKAVLPFLNKIPFTVLDQKVNRVFARYDYDSAKYVGAVSGGSSYKWRVKKSAYKKTYARFENKRYCIPAGYDCILRNVYGNYMELPPEQERRQHEFKAYWKDREEIAME